jgi:cytochrome c-type biogenesis protein CcmF
VLWGTLFPLISEWLQGEKISLDAQWFNRLMIPIGLFLLFLTGVGPLFAWRRTSIESLRRNFLYPGIASVVLVAALLAAGVRNFYAQISFGFCLFVALTVVLEFYKGARQISVKNQMNLLRATVELTHRNTRRYGGYLVHMGIVLMFIGFTGAAFNQNAHRDVKVGDTMTIGNYDLKIAEMKSGETENYIWQRAIVNTSRNGKPLGQLEPEHRFYKASRQPTHVVSVRHRLNEDLYLNLAATEEKTATLQAYIFPLVSWIWMGAVVLVFGTLVALVPSKVKMQYARTEVVGITTKNVPVEK